MPPINDFSDNMDALTTVCFTESLGMTVENGAQGTEKPVMTMQSHGNTYCITGPLCGEPPEAHFNTKT